MPGGTGVIWLNFFARYGFDLTAVTDRETLAEAAEMAVDIPAWPEDGSIMDEGDYLIVKLGAI